MDHVVIIGAYGSAGVAVAESLVDASNLRLTLVDDGDPGGGLCILRGCMPSKDLLSAGAHLEAAESDDRLAASITPDLTEIVAQKDEHVSSFAAHRRAYVHELAERDDVTFIHGSARFVGEQVVEAGGQQLAADYVVVATGSRVNVPDVRGIERVSYQTSADVLDATTMPDSGIVMGFGAVGLELVPYLAEIGNVDLTVVEHDDRPLDAAPPAFGDWVLHHYRERYDVEILTNSHEQQLAETDHGVRLTVEQGEDTVTRAADTLYLFTGRRPAIDRLDLPAGGIDPAGDWVGETLQATADERVFVVGDANAWDPILHIAKEQGYHAAENLLAHRAGQPTTPFSSRPHQVIFSGLGTYPYARLGHTEETARAAGYEPIVAERAASDDGVFKVKNVASGLARLIVARDGTILGYHGIHYQADTMAKTMQVILEADMHVGEVPDRAFHPTTPEIIDGLLRDASVALGESGT